MSSPTQRISARARHKGNTLILNRDNNDSTPNEDSPLPRRPSFSSHLASSVKHGYMGAIQQLGGMPELLKRQIDRLETAIDLSTDWLEIQYLMVELNQLKALYDDAKSEAA